MKTLVVFLSLFTSVYAHALVFTYLDCKSNIGLTMKIRNQAKNVTVNYENITKPFTISEGPYFNPMTQKTHIGMGDEALFAQGDYSFYTLEMNGEMTISDAIQTAQGTVAYSYANGIVRIPYSSPADSITCQYQLVKDAFGE